MLLTPDLLCENNRPRVDIGTKGGGKDGDGNRDEYTKEMEGS